MRGRLTLLLGLLAACSAAPTSPAPERQVPLVVVTAKPLAEVSPRFLSFAVDTAQVVGGEFWAPDGSGSLAGSTPVPPYDFSRPRLRRLARELAPAYLRIGGTAADETFYDLTDQPVTTPPTGYKWVLNRTMWDGIHGFATALNLRLLVTLNAGPGPRDANGAWTADNARELLRHSAAKSSPVDVWELGNEINGYLLLLKLSVDEQTYTDDLQLARQLLQAEAPQAKLAGPSCAFWPATGDFIGFYSKFMKLGGDRLDIVTWHYYPQQSRRCPLATRRAGPQVLLQPDNLAEVETWAKQVEDAVPGSAPIWLGETGNAQCGGEPGVSDSFVGGFWWLDQLGRMARRGQQVVVRQTLSGSDYGLIDEATLEPNPDYWSSVLWKRLMGTRVLDVQPSGTADPLVRAYAHCGAQGGVALVALNLDEQQPVRLRLDGLDGPGELYLLTADSLQARTVQLNGQPLLAAADGAPPRLDPAAAAGSAGHHHVDLPPATYAFIAFPRAAAPACD